MCQTSVPVSVCDDRRYRSQKFVQTKEWTFPGSLFLTLIMEYIFQVALQRRQKQNMALKKMWIPETSAVLANDITAVTTPDKSNLRRKVYLTPRLRCSHLSTEGKIAGPWCSASHFVCSQEGKQWVSAGLLMQPQTPAQGMVSPTLSESSCLCVIKITLTSMPEAYLLGDCKSYQVDSISPWTLQNDDPVTWSWYYYWVLSSPLRKLPGDAICCNSTSISTSLLGFQV